MHEYQKTFKSETIIFQQTVIATILLSIKKKITTNKRLWHKSENKHPIIVHTKKSREREKHIDIKFSI